MLDSTTIDTSALTSAQLMELRQKIDSDLVTRRNDEIGAAMTQIKDLVATHEITQEMLMAQLFPRTKSKVRSNSETKNPPKYMNPDSGETWTGRGRKPNWIKAAKNPSAFLIGASSPVNLVPRQAA